MKDKKSIHYRNTKVVGQDHRSSFLLRMTMCMEKRYLPEILKIYWMFNKKDVIDKL